ncbi:hypothetical protein LTR08_008544 [Meristemomyces frigidus]|nr:hypothetical protein LTR08_008544 [Meristemomyces frigidus]
MAEQLAILNPHPAVLPGPELLHQLVARNHPGAAAAIEHCSQSGTVERLSYGDLDTRSSALAYEIMYAHRTNTASSNGHRFIVPVYASQCLELYICQLAILKAGGAFCPIALDAPEERLRFILQDIEATVLLTTSDFRSKLPQLDGIKVVVADNTTLPHNSESQLPLIQPSQAAYIMYTSGSTGTPKGVVISHSAATQALLAHDSHIPPFSRFLQFANSTFDVSVFETFFPLYRGATLITCERRRLLNDLSGVINELNVDAAELTPSVADSLLHDRQTVPSLKLLLTIGEMLKKSVVEEFASDSETEGILYGMYGPTEATIHCTLQTRFTKTMPVNNIGKPLATVSAFIVKPAEGASGDAPEILAIGEEGELAVGGHQLADGYLNREEQTKAAFVQHPQFGRLYRTGDRACMTPDGSINCLGRISSGQVKLRGQRIELGEIEHAAAQTEGCRSVVANVFEGALVAFCVCTDPKITTEDIWQSCRNWLPAYMVPNDIVLVDAFPYLPSGKLDRKQLSSNYAKSKRPASTVNDTASPRAMEIMAIVSGVLRVDIGVTTHLSSAGLDSLSAIRIASQLNRHGFPQLDANAILEARDVHELDDAIAQAEQLAHAPVDSAQIEGNATSLLGAALHHPLLVNIQDQIEEVFATTPVQSAMLSETSRNPQAYCNWLAFDLVDCGNVAKVEAALRRLSEVHKLLRSGFLTTVESDVSHAVVVWKRPSRSYISVVEDFDYHFTIQNEEDALHACCFQLQRGDGSIRLLLKIHHALYDQWSIDILKADLSAILQDRDLDQVLAFSQVSAFYAANLEQARSNEAIEFWQDHLRDCSTSLVPDLVGRTVSECLSRSSWQDLTIDLDGARRKAQDLGISLPAVFQAAFACLTGYYSGSHDVLFGAVFSGRHHAIPGIERTFGPCLATLPCRVDLSSVHTGVDLMRLVHSRNRAMQRHSLTTLSDIKKASQCAPGTNLFDALFVWQETSLTPATTDTLVAETDSADYHEFHLVLEFSPTAAGVAVRATYQQSLLPPSQVELAIRQLECIAKQLLQAPTDPIESLPSAFSQDLLSISNGRPSPCAGTFDLVGTIEQHAMERPDSWALSFAQSIGADGADIDTMTYGDLNARANRLANHLHTFGVNSMDSVCICMEKSFDLYIAILAVLKSGAGYLPLVPETPPARVEAILRQAHISISLCDTASAEMIRSVSSATIMDVQHLDLHPYSAENLGVRAAGSSLAYTVFTSGSTGEPKGVAVTRDNLAGNLAALSELYPAGSRDRLLQACSPAFDVSVFEIFFSLGTGMCLCTATKGVLFQDFERSIRAFEVTHLSLTPTVAALVEPANVPSVRFLVTAGEAISPSVHAMWAGRGLHQGYGPSETTNICTVNMNMEPEDSLGNIGKSLRNTSAFVVSPGDEFAVLPAGALGEFAFGGEQVFRGYLGREDLNSTKLIDHPQYGRIYRSGDVGRVLSDGSLLIRGRLDDQVKLRGNRIELGEINATMLRSPEVQDCTTLLIEDERSGQALAAFWVPKAATAKSSQQACLTDSDQQMITRLFEHLDTLLPGYMVPEMLIPIPRLPLTAQGKLDQRLLRRTLLTIDGSSRETFSRQLQDAGDDDAWSAEDEEIATALANTLRILRTQVQRTTSFFALGLNSLNAIALAKAVGRSLHRIVSIDTVLRNPSVARLSGAISALNQTAVEVKPAASRVFSAEFVARVASECDAQGTVMESVLPCTPLQEAMLSATASASKGQSSYQNATTFKLMANMEKLKECWIELVKRHAILRTHFVDTDIAGYPFAQIVVKHKALSWHSIQEYRNGQTYTDQGCSDVSILEPFHVEVDKKESTITLRMHHAIYDGLSMSILLQEAEQLYDNISLPEPVSFEPFLAEALAHSGPEAMQCWSARVHDFQPRPFPPSGERVPTSSSQFTMTQSLAVDLNSLATFCKRHSVTPLSLFQAAWAKVLFASQQTDDICVGTVFSGRSVAVPAIERLAAPCFNTIPTRVQLNPTKSVTNVQLVQQIHTQNIEDMKYQLVSLRRVQRLSRSPHLALFDSVLLLQPPRQTLNSSIWALISEEGTMGDMSIILELTSEGSGYEVAIHCLPTIISKDMAEHLVHAFASALSHCLRYPSSEAQSVGAYDPIHIVGKLESQRENETLLANAPSSEIGNAWTTEEAHVRQVFADLSSTDVNLVKKGTSMYQLGLDSLNAAQVAARLRKLGVNVDATHVMENLTPSAISAAAAKNDPSCSGRSTRIDLDAYDAEHRKLLVGSIDLDMVEAVRPCTAVQCGMLAQSLQSYGTLYVNHITYRVPKGITDKGMREAWKAVQQKHQSLRMGFYSIDHPRKPFVALVWTADQAMLSSCETEDDVESIERHAAKDIVTQLHLPAWRVSVSHAGMTLSIHHALYDAESLQFLLGDFDDAINSCRLTLGPSVDTLLSSALSAETDDPGAAATCWQSLLNAARYEPPQSPGDPANILQSQHFPELAPYQDAVQRASVDITHLQPTSV